MNYKIYLYTKFIGIPQIQKNYPMVFDRPINNYNQYISYLFNESRIEQRLIYFKELTLKSILNQTYQNFEWIIFISNLLPDKYKTFIKNISNEKIKIIEVSNKRTSNQQLIELHSPKETTYISCRLDDDDGLCGNYFDILNTCHSHNEEIVATKEFLCVSYDMEKLQFRYSKTQKDCLISTGLSSKNRHIYSVGSHLKADKLSYRLIEQRYPVIQSAGDHTFTHRSHQLNSNISIFDMESFLKNLYE